MKKVGFWINFAPLCAHSRFFSILVTGRKLFWWEATCFWFLNFDFFVWEKCLRSRRSSVSVLSLTSDIAATFQRQRRDKSSIRTFCDGLLVWWSWISGEWFLTWEYPLRESINRVWLFLETILEYCLENSDRRDTSATSRDTMLQNSSYDHSNNVLWCGDAGCS